MKVEYETEHRPNYHREYLYNLSTLPPSKAPVAVQNQPFCCDGMNGAWHDRVIHFNEDTGKVNIIKAESSEEDSWFEYYPIDYCPFCGQKIELIETKRTEFVRKTEKHEVENEVWEPLPP